MGEDGHACFGGREGEGSRGQPESMLLSRQPRGSKASVLCISLWMIYPNTLVSPCENVENVVVEKWITTETPALAQAAACCCHTRSGTRL